MPEIGQSGSEGGATIPLSLPLFFTLPPRGVKQRLGCEIVKGSAEDRRDRDPGPSAKAAVKAPAEYSNIYMLLHAGFMTLNSARHPFCNA